MKKTISVIALAMCMIFAFGSFAIAATKPVDSIQWDSGAKCTPYLSISTATATAKCKLYVNAENPNHSITATLMLQKKQSDGSYDNVKTWSKLTGKGSVDFVDSYSPVSGTDYRLKAIVYVTGSGGTDTITRFAY